MNKTLIAIDIGNTNITIGIFTDGRLAKKAKIAARYPSLLYEKRLRKLLPSEVACDVVISSVVPEALGRLKKILKKIDPYFYGKVRVAGEDFQVPIKNLYRKKSQVGQDRLINAFAAEVLYGAPALVIDFGTAITFDVVSSKGDYLGGLILPGIEMGLESLYKKTALLPKVKLIAVCNLIGRDTADSMRGGILFGYGAMCDGLIGMYRKMCGSQLKVVATGGDSSLMKRYSRSIQIVDEDLTLKGLSKLS